MKINSITNCLIVCLLLLSNNSVKAGEFSVVVDKPTLFAISYGETEIPNPFKGAWILAVRYPRDIDRTATHTWSWKKTEKHTISVDWSVKNTRPDGTVDEMVDSDRFIIDLNDWSNGIYDEGRRKGIVESETLLDFHKPADRVTVEGGLPDGLTITRHIIGFRDGNEVSLVIYQANDMEIIRKHHIPPLFFRWGRDLDQSYHIEDNKKWLRQVREKNVAASNASGQ